MIFIIILKIFLVSGYIAFSKYVLKTYYSEIDIYMLP